MAAAFSSWTGLIVRCPVVTTDPVRPCELLLENIHRLARPSRQRAPEDNLQGRMSLSDKKSDESESLRRLLIGYSPDEIDLTQDGSLFVITHKPSSCSDCTEWFKDVRQIASPDLIGGLESEFGCVKGSVFARLETGQRQRLEEIAQLVDKHLKTLHDDELARMTKEAAEKDQSRRP
jgi:hypothetical protein